MKFIILCALFVSTSVLACPNLEGHFKCKKSDLFKTQYFKVKKIENGYLFQDKITVLDEDFKEVAVVRNYKHVLGDSTSVIDTGRFTILIKDKVSCDGANLVVESARTYTMTNETHKFRTTFHLNKRGDLVYEGLETFTCKRK